MIFRMSDTGPPLVRDVLLELGWKEHDEEVDNETDWNLWWKSTRFTNSEIQSCVKSGEQKLNHIPNSSAMTKKVSLNVMVYSYTFTGLYGENTS
jgi:tubulin polyglutamylase TTLL2